MDSQKFSFYKRPDFGIFIRDYFKTLEVYINQHFVNRAFVGEPGQNVETFIKRGTSLVVKGQWL